MNNVKAIQKLNETELRLGLDTKKSWHEQYRDSAYVFVGGLDYGLTEGDILAIFSQYGEIVNINLVRDKKTGKPKGFCFLAFEDQRSTVLAVDNFNGIKVCGRTIRVDHVNQYRRPKDEHGSEIVEKGCAPRTPTPSPTPSPSPTPPPEKKKKKNKQKKKKKKKTAKHEKRSRSMSPASHSASDSEQERAESRTLGGQKRSERTTGGFGSQEKEKWSDHEVSQRKGRLHSESESEAKAHARGHSSEDREETVLQKQKRSDRATGGFGSQEKEKWQARAHARGHSPEDRDGAVLQRRQQRPRARSRSRSPVNRMMSPSRSPPPPPPPPTRQRARDYRRRSRDRSPHVGAWHESGSGRSRDSREDSRDGYMYRDKPHHR